MTDRELTQQKPVGWHHPECEGKCIACCIQRVVHDTYGARGVKYLLRHVTAQQQIEHQWQGLGSDDEVLELSKDAWGRDKLGFGRDDHTAFYVAFARLIEAKLKEKNG